MWSAEGQQLLLQSGDAVVLKAQGTSAQFQVKERRGGGVFI